MLNLPPEIGCEPTHAEDKEVDRLHGNKGGRMDAKCC
jgi:hypothetical protein